MAFLLMIAVYIDICNAKQMPLAVFIIYVNQCSPSVWQIDKQNLSKYHIMMNLTIYLMLNK